MRLDPLYHWSPTERRKLIRAGGLKPFQAPVAHTGQYAYPYISLSPDPALAWQLSGNLEHTAEIELWDLWLVRVPEHANVEVRPEWGPEIHEVKVRDSVIPPDRLWYVATRGHFYAELLDGTAEIGSGN